jgi:tRNA nucleotidyltransferase/poly(A) polymerase
MDLTAKVLSKNVLKFFGRIKNYRFLVYGGLVRDFIRQQLGEDTREIEEVDVDILLLHDDFDEAVDMLSRHTKALFPALIKERTVRVVVGEDESVDVAIVPTSVDLAKYPFDFTINTFYCDGRTLLEGGKAEIYTPFRESWQDIQRQILRAPNPAWLKEYPFGAIRGIRLYCQLPTYEFEKETLRVYPYALGVARWEISPLLIVREFAKAISHSLRRFAEALYLTHADRILFSPLHKVLRGKESQHLFLTLLALLTTCFTPTSMASAGVSSEIKPAPFWRISKWGFLSTEIFST